MYVHPGQDIGGVNIITNNADDCVFQLGAGAALEKMTLTQRGVWYPITNHADGWENRIDLNKKLTETLSVSIRHEIREHNPDGTAQDYKRLKLLLGFDF